MRKTFSGWKLAEIAGGDWSRFHEQGNQLWSQAGRLPFYALGFLSPLRGSTPLRITNPPMREAWTKWISKPVLGHACCPYWRFYPAAVMDWHSWECSETKKDLWVTPLEGWASSSPHWKGGDSGKVQQIWSKLPGTILFLPDLLELILIKKRKIFPLKTNLTTCPKSLKAKESFFCVRAHFL